MASASQTGEPHASGERRGELASPAVSRTIDSDAATARRPGSRAWVWILVAFALQLTAWAAWFVIASQHRVAEVPLESAAGARP